MKQFYEILIGESRPMIPGYGFNVTVVKNDNGCSRVVSTVRGIRQAFRVRQVVADKAAWFKVDRQNIHGCP